MTAPGVRPHSPGRDIAWSVLAAVMAIYGVVAVAGIAAAIVSANGFGALWAFPSILFCYWVGMGAWRRTSWGAAR